MRCGIKLFAQRESRGFKGANNLVNGRLGTISCVRFISCENVELRLYLSEPKRHFRPLPMLHTINKDMLSCSECAPRANPATGRQALGKGRERPRGRNEEKEK